MFEKILIPTDFSQNSKAVIECVKEFPGAKDVILLHIIGPADPLARVWDPGGRVAEAQAKLSEQEMLLQGKGLNVKTMVQVLTEGELHRAIQRVADVEGANLIAMSARGKGVIEGLLLGNVAKNVLRYGNTTLLLMHYRILEGEEGIGLEEFCPHPLARVLCPTDLSKPAEEAIDLIKRSEGVSEILLQHVVFQGETWKEVGHHVEEASKKVDVLASEIKKAGIKARTHVSVGSPAEEISILAGKEKVSMIAMNAYGKGWFEQLTVGSITYDVAKKAGRPVLVIRTKPISSPP